MTIDVVDAGGVTRTVMTPDEVSAAIIDAVEAVEAALSADPATQTTLAAVLAKIIAAPATEAKQDTANTALAIIDDWDESDRAKVNPIAGQAGVAAGAGTVGATTQRVVHGSAAGLATTQNALSTTAESVIASNSARLFAEVKNSDAAIDVYLGDDNTVTAANGHLLRPGESFAFERYTGAVWAIAASGTPTVTTIEW